MYNFMAGPSPSLLQKYLPNANGGMPPSNVPMPPSAMPGNTPPAIDAGPSPDVMAQRGIMQPPSPGPVMAPAPLPAQPPSQGGAVASFVNRNKQPQGPTGQTAQKRFNPNMSFNDIQQSGDPLWKKYLNLAAMQSMNGQFGGL